jgi:transposase-like protein
VKNQRSVQLAASMIYVAAHQHGYAVSEVARQSGVPMNTLSKARAGREKIPEYCATDMERLLPSLKRLGFRKVLAKQYD